MDTVRWWYVGDELCRAFVALCKFCTLYLGFICLVVQMVIESSMSCPSCTMIKEKVTCALNRHDCSCHLSTLPSIVIFWRQWLVENIDEGVLTFLFPQPDRTPMCPDYDGNAQPYPLFKYTLWLNWNQFKCKPSCGFHLNWNEFNWK